MTASQQIQERIIHQIKRDAETIADPVELVAAAQAGGYWWAQVSAFSGADQFHAREKFRVGVKGQDASPEKYAQYNKPMNAENFPGRAYSHEDALGAFDERIIRDLDAMLDAQEDFWRDLYRRHLSRDPDAEGLAWWKAEVERQFIAGIK